MTDAPRKSPADGGTSDRAEFNLHNIYTTHSGETQDMAPRGPASEMWSYTREQVLRGDLNPVAHDDSDAQFRTAGVLPPEAV